MPNIGTLRENLFRFATLPRVHQVHYHDRGDFIVNEKYIFEIGGGTKKTSRQLGDQANCICSVR